MLLSIFLTATMAASAFAQSSTFSPLRPPAIPLAVKSPYMSTWIQAGSDDGNGGYLPGRWPSFWNGNATGWTGMIRVDNTTYTWMGAPSNDLNVNQTAFSYTSTRSIFTMDAGGLVQMVVTFLSGITPQDLMRSSLPYTYLNVDVKSLDGQDHSVQLYTDISAEWVSGDRNAVAEWSYGSSNSTDNGVSFHRVGRQTQLEFSSTDDQADWGYWIYATANTSGLSYMSGGDNTVRGGFAQTGTLPSTQDTNYRAINEDYPVFGFAVDLGEINDTTVSTLFQLSLHQQNCILFEGSKDLNSSLPCMWTNYYADETSAVQFFYDDYSNAALIATAFDGQVQSDSEAAGGQDYASLTSLSVRQAFGGFEYAGTPAQPLAFLKEISSDGNVNTVDVIMPFHPIALYMNATILKALLDPLFMNQESGNWPFNYSIHDVGANFPNATGHNDGSAEPQPLEECGNMLIMTLAYAQRANDNDYLVKHYNILNQWTTFLAEEALYPGDQISTDDFAGAAPNQTNLGLKGIIGIRAMAQIANRTNHADDGANYTNIANDYISQWQSLGTNKASNPPHTTFNYGNDSSYNLLYNLYGDAELGLHLVPQSVYDQQSSYYATVFNTYGVPLDSRHTYTKLDWEMWVAAIASNSTKEQFISALAKWANETPTNYPLTDLYDSISGDYPINHTFIARPVVGGLFSLLALESAPDSGTFIPGVTQLQCARVGNAEKCS